VIKADDFVNELHRMMLEAIQDGTGTVDINTGDLHRRVGGYPGPDHRMPLCCQVMHAEFAPKVDTILESPPSGQGASLTIRYVIPRPNKT
jgi:5-methylcytosine-specific restriction protein A